MLLKSSLYAGIVRAVTLEPGGADSLADVPFDFVV
jgi:hypothetical protein